MPRKNRAYKKGAAFRDARLFVIVAEGDREDTYFRYFQGKSQRIKIKIVPREGGKSAPNFFLKRVEKFRESGEWSPKEGDFLWFVLDVDRWKRKEIDTLQEACETYDNWGLGMSNPCFEVWLHFHLGSISNQEMSCKELKQSIPEKIAGGFHVKTICPLIQTATTNAREADNTPDHYFPGPMQTKL